MNLNIFESAEGSLHATDKDYPELKWYGFADFQRIMRNFIKNTQDHYYDLGQISTPLNLSIRKTFDIHPSTRFFLADDAVYMNHHEFGAALDNNLMDAIQVFGFPDLDKFRITRSYPQYSALRTHTA